MPQTESDHLKKLYRQRKSDLVSQIFLQNLSFQEKGALKAAYWTSDDRRNSPATLSCLPTFMNLSGSIDLPFTRIS